MSPAAFVLRDLHFAYPGKGPRFRVPHLEAAAGECLALTGPSGCGKTTLLHLLAGLLHPSAGSLQVLGRDLVPLSDPQRCAFRAANLGIVFQELELIPFLSADANLLLVHRLMGHRPDPQRLAHLTERCGIAHLRAQAPRRMSQGERQRLAVCRALLHQPGLVLADEPTGNLDLPHAHAVTELLVQEARALGCGLVMVTHDPGLLRHFDRSVSLPDLVEREDPR